MLLDGGFVKRKLKVDGLVTAQRISALAEAIGRHGELDGILLHRVYYYDAAPLARTVAHPLTGEPIEYAKTAAFLHNSRLARDVARLPHYALRQGQCSHDGWEVRARALEKTGMYDPATDVLALQGDELKPLIRQKGVDMRIGMDIASLALKRHVDVIVLVTADSDFVPAIKFARREGVQLHLFSLGHGVSDDLVENVDLFVPSSARMLMGAQATP